MSENITGAMSRRRLLTVLSAGVASISGCGGGGGDGTSTIAANGPMGNSSTAVNSATTTPSSSPASSGANPSAPSPLPADTAVVSGSIATSEVGGSSLRVQSAYWRNNPVSGATFSTVASTQNSQLLILADHSSPANGVLRALSIAIPGGPAPVFSAASTAVAAIMLTLGILTVDPAATSERIASIQSLPSFALFSAYVLSKLPTVDLINLGKDPQFINLRAAVTADFFATLPVARAVRLNAFVPRALGSFATGELDATYTAAANATGPSSIALSNPALRFVSVARTSLDASGNVLASSVFPKLKGSQVPGRTAAQTNLIGGKNAADWGNLLTLQTGAPGTASDELIPDNNVATLRYTFVGPGIPGGPALAADLSLSQFGLKAATVATVFFYFLGPLLDFVGGASTILKQISNEGLKTVDEIAFSLGGLAVNTGGLDAALASGDKSATIGALINLELAVLGLSAGVLVATGVVSETAPLVVALGVLGEFSALMAFSNIEAATVSLLSHALVGTIDVPVPARGSRYLPARVKGIASGDVILSNPQMNSHGDILYFANEGIRLLKGGVDTLVAARPSNYSDVVYTNLNDLGHFAYAFIDLNADQNPAYLYRDGAIVNLGIIGQVSPGALTVHPTAINNKDEVVGWYSTRPAATYDAAAKVFIWRNDALGGYMSELSGLLPPSYSRRSYGVRNNDAGQVAILLSTQETNFYPLRAQLKLLDGESITDIPLPYYFNTYPYENEKRNDGSLYGINASGQVLYFSYASQLSGATGSVNLWTHGSNLQIPANLGFLNPVDHALANDGSALGRAVGDIPLIYHNNMMSYLAPLVDWNTDVPAPSDAGGTFGSKLLYPLMMSSTGVILAVVLTVANDFTSAIPVTLTPH